MSVFKSSFSRAAFGTIGLLLIPLVAMQFTSEVNWTLSDFVVMGTMLFITGFALDQVLKRGGTYRFAVAGIIILLFLWLWAELAVGIFTTWGS